MNVAVIDADLIGRNRHRFPNLACMKISGYHKARGDSVTLKTNYDALTAFDKVYLAKVFSDTPIPASDLFGSVLDLPNLTFGGTGFFYDNAPPLPPEVEHSMPDYHLYDVWAGSGSEFKAYRDYSIGFLTRGCFRHCPFCVNRRANQVVKHSPLTEFLDTTRKKICLLDDNFFGYADWRAELTALIDTGKPFHFKQGLDARLLDDAKAELLFNARYDGDFIFAFDDWRDRDVIERKLKLIRRYDRRRQRVKFYCLCGYDRGGSMTKSSGWRIYGDWSSGWRCSKSTTACPTSCALNATSNRPTANSTSTWRLGATNRASFRKCRSPYSPDATATADSLPLSCSTFNATWRNTMTKILTFACWLIAAPVVFAGIVLNAALNFFEELSNGK